MRTTISLEKDVAAMLEKAQKELHEKPKSLINRALREGLVQISEKKKQGRKKRFSTKEVSLGKCSLANLDNIAEVLSIVEGEAYR